jgi:hypothetical protein
MPAVTESDDYYFLRLRFNHPQSGDLFAASHLDTPYFTLQAGTVVTGRVLSVDVVDQADTGWGGKASLDGGAAADVPATFAPTAVDQDHTLTFEAPQGGG